MVVLTASLLFLIAPLAALLWGVVIALAYSVYVAGTVVVQVMCHLVATQQRYERQRAYQQWCMAQAYQAQAAQACTKPARRRRS